MILWFAVVRESRGDVLTVTFLDVGQGDSIFIESPSGVQVLVDGGPNNNLMKEISSVLPWYDRHIDMLVVTNPDRDHYEGFISLLKKFKADVLLEPGTANKNEAYSVLEKIVTDKKVPKVLARRGQVIDLGDGAFLRIIFPDRDVSGLNPNDGSIVMQLVYRETSVLLQGDSTANIEHYLASLDIDLESSILKVGHHGSRTSTSEEYVRLVSPGWAIISAGENNSYGHPHKEVLDTLNKIKTEILATCTMGRIIFESNGKEFYLKNKKVQGVEVGCK
ncbi:MAG: Competence protein ComEC [Parcubacteria group bacterium GW2011_GWB1_40_5]|nr:MAG: Competence protein ComEC [Parcubacteria group bacterium GW2011_GWB1_40_5]KKR82000.1 MAG: Competence protein ComEC [Parcubacteria group bacterium GW2011_GWD1_40_9]